MKSEGESDDEEKTDERELEEGLHHVREHDHVDTQEGKFSHVRQLKVGKIIIFCTIIPSQPDSG